MADNNQLYQVIHVPGLNLSTGLVDQKNIIKNFGQLEDSVELHVYDANNQLIQSQNSFIDYILDPTKPSEIKLNPRKVLKSLGYSSGKFALRLNFQKTKIFNIGKGPNPFIIKEISNSRTEIRTITPNITNALLDSAVTNFITELESSAYFKEFVLNFGQDRSAIAVNILLNKNTDKHEVLFKLHSPLSDSIGNSTGFKVVEHIINPIDIPVDLGGFQVTRRKNYLRGPNFKIDVRQQNSIPSEYKTYDDILNYQVTSSYEHLLSKLENPKNINVEYDYVKPVSGSTLDGTVYPSYHFENFVHFGSAEERLKKFKVKLQLIESYSLEINKINDPNVGDSAFWAAASGSIYINKKLFEDKRQNVIKGFDGYEQFLYYETGSYSWPKHSPFPSDNVNVYHTSHSNSTSWIGNQLVSASLFDNENPSSLVRTIPTHILENPDNEYYVTFVNMIGHHFDNIWLYIKAITDTKETHNRKGISRDLVYHQLKSLGIEVFDQFENSNLIEYILGEEISGSNFYSGDHYYNYSTAHPSSSLGFGLAVSASENMVTASNEGSIPKGDITKEIWKRIYHNAPYLLKNKGTEAGLRALISCYGIPATALNIKEYGGPVQDPNATRLDPGYKTFSYEKASYALKGTTSESLFFIKSPWSSSFTNNLKRSAKTVEFKIKPTRSGSDNYHLFNLSGSDASKDPMLILRNYVGNNPAIGAYSTSDVSSSGDYINYGNIAYWVNGAVAASTVDFPIFNGDFWNIFIGTDGDSGSSAPVKFGAYQANHLKGILYYTSSITQTEADRAVTFGDPYYGSGVGGSEIGEGFVIEDYIGPNVGGAQHAYFGGVELNDNSSYDYIDTLHNSGSLQEIKYHFGEVLLESTLKKHALEPFMYSGNTPSSSYEHVVIRLPLGANFKCDSSSFHPDIETNYLSPNKATYKLTFVDNPTTTLGTNFPVGGLSLSFNTDLGITGVTNNLYFQFSNGTDYFGLIPNGTQNYNIVIVQLVMGNGAQSAANFAEAINQYNEVNSPTDPIYVNFLGPHIGNLISATVDGNTVTLTQETPGEGGNTQISNTYADSFTIWENPNFVNGGTIEYFTGGTNGHASTVPNPQWEYMVKTHHLPTPDTVGISMTSEKVRIDEGTVDGNILSPTVKAEISTLDRQPLDYEDLGVFFSPTTEINEDIIYTLGAFRLDDYIGSPLPSSQTASIYEDLATIKDYYFRKVKKRFNYWDYLKNIQYIDHTLFKMVENFVPAKANLKTGLLIEPHYLERTKFARELPIRSDAQTMITGSHQHIRVKLNKSVEVPNFVATFSGSKGGGNVVTTNNPVIHPQGVTDSRGRRAEQGTNGTIDVKGYVLDQLQESAQAPIQPYTGQPWVGYKAKKSNTLLGNAQEAKKSRKYYRNLAVGEAVDQIINADPDPLLPPY